VLQASDEPEADGKELLINGIGNYPPDSRTLISWNAEQINSPQKRWVNQWLGSIFAFHEPCPIAIFGFSV
jgi:hypothetical protein